MPMLPPLRQHESDAPNRERRAGRDRRHPGDSDELQRPTPSDRRFTQSEGLLEETGRGGRRKPALAAASPVTRPLRVRQLRWMSTTLALALSMAFCTGVEAAPTDDAAETSDAQASSPPLHIEVDVAVTGHELEDQRIAKEMASSIDKGVRSNGVPTPSAVETTLLVAVRVFMTSEGTSYLVGVTARSGNDEHAIDFPCSRCTADELTERLVQESSEALRVLAARSVTAPTVDLSGVQPSADAQDEPTVPSLGPTSSRFHPRRLGVAGISLAGIGAVSLVTGIGLIFVHGLERPLDGGYVGDVERLETMLAGVTTLGIGGAMTVVGMGLVGADARQQRKDKPDPKRMGPLGIAGFTTLGAGTTACIVGATLAIRGDIEWSSPGDEQVANIAYLRTPGWVTLAVGLGTVAAGTTMLGMDAHRRQRGRTTALVPSITKDGAHLVLAGRF